MAAIRVVKYLTVECGSKAVKRCQVQVGTSSGGGEKLSISALYEPLYQAHGPLLVWSQIDNKHNNNKNADAACVDVVPHVYDSERAPDRDRKSVV